MSPLSTSTSARSNMEASKCPFARQEKEKKSQQHPNENHTGSEEMAGDGISPQSAPHVFGFNDEAQRLQLRNAIQKCPAFAAAAAAVDNGIDATPAASNAATTHHDDTRTDGTIVTSASTASVSASAGPTSCPFAQVKTSDELQDLIVRVPESHWQQTEFVQSLHGFHSSMQVHAPQNQQKDPTQKGDNNDQQQQQQQQQPSRDSVSSNGGQDNLWGSCPVKQRLSAKFQLGENTSFSELMDSYSMMGIMAKLIEEDARVHGRRSILKTIENSDHSEGSESSSAESYLSNDPDGMVTAAAIATAAAMATPLQEAIPVSTAPQTTVDDGKDDAGNRQQSSATKSQRRLSQALQTGTKLSHDQAEQVHFVKNFVRGKIDRELYTHYVWGFYHVYKKLEECCDLHGPTRFPTLHFPKELYRTSALYEDVDFWIGWGDDEDAGDDGDANNLPLPISPATRDYMDRLDHISRTNPILLLSHAYTRYLGDLSGGKVLARIAKRALKLDNGKEGLAFYEFQNVPSFKVFKDHYRAALDELGKDCSSLPGSPESLISDFVHEANIAFGLNVRIFEELDVAGGVVGAAVRPLREVYDMADEAVKQGDGKSGGAKADEQQTAEEAAEEAAAAECPFLKRKSSADPHAQSQQQQQQQQQKQKQHHHQQSTHNPISSESEAQMKGHCPWPFLLLHDPAAGLKKWQTWVVIGWALSIFYSHIIAESSR